MTFRNNRLTSHIFLAVYISQLNLWRNIASNIASKNHSKISIYSKRAVNYNTAATALLEYLNLHARFMLASGYNYRRLSIRLIPSYLCATASGVNYHKLSHFTAMDGQYQANSCIEAILCCSSKSIGILSRSHLTARTIITKLLYGEALVIFRA